MTIDLRTINWLSYPLSILKLAPTLSIDIRKSDIFYKCFSHITSLARIVKRKIYSLYKKVLSALCINKLNFYLNYQDSKYILNKFNAYDKFADTQT